MRPIVCAFPLQPGVENEVREMAGRLSGEYRDKCDAFYRHYNVDNESWHLQQTPHGMWLISVTIMEETIIEEKAAEYGASNREFDRWFKDQVKRFCGADLDNDPLGPPTENVFTWDDGD